MSSFLKRHFPASLQIRHPHASLVWLHRRAACLAACLPAWSLTMASRRRAGDSLKTDKKKKRKNKTRCEEAAELCSLVEDERVKKSAQEAWSQRTSHRHGDSLKSRFHITRQMHLTRETVWRSNVNALTRPGRLNCSMIFSWMFYYFEPFQLYQAWFSK